MRPAPCDRLPKERYRRTPSTQYIDQDKERGPCPPFMMRRMHCMRPCHHVGGRGSLTKTRTEYSEASSVDAWTGARPQASSRTKPMSRFDIQACMHVSMHISECAMHVCVYNGSLTGKTTLRIQENTQKTLGPKENVWIMDALRSSEFPSTYGVLY